MPLIKPSLGHLVLGVLVEEALDCLRKQGHWAAQLESKASVGNKTLHSAGLIYRPDRDSGPGYPSFWSRFRSDLKILKPNANLKKMVACIRFPRSYAMDPSRV